jgi:hypothetical protein
VDHDMGLRVLDGRQHRTKDDHNSDPVFHGELTVAGLSA